MNTPTAPATATAMRAWSQRRYGGPDAVHPIESEVPRPAASEVLVRVSVCALNSADVRLMRGDPRLIRLAFGLRRPRAAVQGRDVCGTVVAAGADVAGLSPGDRVAGEIDGGGLAGFVAVPRAKLVSVPAELDDATAAALPLAGGTAWQALDLARVGEGSRVLVLGAGGGVGMFAVRLAVLRGAEVHARCSPRAAEAVREQGAQRIEDRDRDLSALPAHGYDAILDLGGRAPLRSLRRLLRTRGCIVGISGGEHRWFGPLGRMALGALLSLSGRRRFRPLVATAKPEITRELLALAASGELVPVIAHRYPFAEAPAALAHLDDGRAVGKVLVLGSPPDPG
ncbi:NAD(P)-dependent alcohol dehydrogenase [Leucobacter weissii]|uniref:NAD(P)-dependent alcohol dehydrogenase n=1 Tax=Leucobacter weissii TaxID=1983706 RepID=A0A939MN08_9MICO|nr:NAD(P)-dependent alcohol dehydrogenase [Leucobacter weissii]MBO1901787.1 NAD(P)-dependent alcohol dehydrogenase [Leucobacter weissii]